MSLPDHDDIVTMDFAWRGQSFVKAEAKESIDTLTLDWAWRGQPFVVSGGRASAVVAAKHRWFLAM